MSYDIKFKQRAVEYQREGHTYKETCKVFKISETTLTRWINKEKEGKLGEVKIQVRKPANEGWYPKGDSAKADALVSQSPTYPVHHLPILSIKLQ